MKELLTVLLGGTLLVGGMNVAYKGRATAAAWFQEAAVSGSTPTPGPQPDPDPGPGPDPEPDFWQPPLPIVAPTHATGWLPPTENGVAK